eukprot:UN26364
MAARYFNQCSKFGAMLDMITDRLSTMFLSFVLAMDYPNYWYLFAGFSLLDIGSHWLHFVSKLQGGNDSHKDAHNRILRFYYTGYIMEGVQFSYALFVVCVGQEAFLL